MAVVVGNQRKSFNITEKITFKQGFLMVHNVL